MELTLEELKRRLELIETQMTQTANLYQQLAGHKDEIEHWMKRWHEDNFKKQTTPSDIDSSNAVESETDL
jgi:hypothetical protein